MICVEFVTGDLRDIECDALCGTTNPFLNLSGGVGAALSERVGAGLQEELHAFLVKRNRKHFEPGTVVKSALTFHGRRIYMAVSSDGFGSSSEKIVARCVSNVIRYSVDENAKSLAIPFFGTGYGHLGKDSFLSGFWQGVKQSHSRRPFHLFVVSTEELNDYS